jgi:hypothetical protein
MNHQPLIVCFVNSRVVSPAGPATMSAPPSRPARRLAFAAVLALVALNLAWVSPPNLRGNLGVHDPSTMIKCNGRYYVFSTGNNISVKSSADKIYWVAEPTVFTSPPAWTASVPQFTGNFWAPDVIYFNGLYHVYYSCSSFGSQNSAIGLVTNPTLDPTDPSYQWTDQGPVIQSSTGDAYNCIDPCVTFDTSSNLWMSFGSFWSGIYMVRLDNTTGLLNSTPSLTHLAYNGQIEASCIYHHGSYYYLFVNWGTCCSGVNSTYNIRVGRSANITGPYLDRDGVSMVSNGGSLFLKTTGKYIGPGHMGIMNEDGTYWFTYHYYDANVNGAPTMDVENLSWSADGWPVFTNDWCADYSFRFDARDDNGEYYGLLQNGASVHYDPVLGGVLNLDGTSQYVVLPDGAGNALTLTAVFKWNGGADWQRVLDFGRDTNHYAFITPSAANGRIRFAISLAGPAGEQVLDAPAAAPVGNWTQVAVTTDGSRGILYLNGAPVATNGSMTLTLPDIAPTSDWFGRSQFSVDPYFDGQISSVRLYGKALTAAEIVAPQPSITAPASDLRYQPGDTIDFAGTAADFADMPLSVTGLTWTVEFYDSGVTNLVLGPLSGVAGGSFSIPATGAEATNGYHRIALTAVDTLGRSATKFVDVYPGPADWTSYYTFDNGAADTNGIYNGTLVNGATTPTDVIRGPVLNLSGSSQYVSLPTGVGGMRTFAAWVKRTSNNNWQRIFDFGADTTRYVMFTVRANNGRPRVEIRNDQAGGARSFDAPSSLPLNTWTHVAVTFDGRQGVLFIDGQAVAVNSSINLLPSDVIGSANYIGRSQFGTDPYYSGQMDSVQIASQCMPIEHITASTIGVSGNSSSLTLDWPSWNNGLVLKSSTGLDAGATWTTVGGTPLSTNGVNFLTLTPSAGPEFFRLQLP